MQRNGNELRKQDPNITEKQINQKLSIAFNHERTVGSFASRRRSSRWKLMIQNEMDSFAENSNVTSNDGLTCADTKYKTSFASKMDSTSNEESKNVKDPSDEMLIEMGNILKYQESNSNILEKEATGIVLI